MPAGLGFVAETEVEAGKLEMDARVFRGALQGFQGLGCVAGFGLCAAEREECFDISRHFFRGAGEPFGGFFVIFPLQENFAEELERHGKIGVQRDRLLERAFGFLVPAGELELKAQPGEDLSGTGEARGGFPREREGGGGVTG